MQNLISSEIVRKVQRKTRDTLLVKWKRWEQNAIRKSDKTNTAID
jgi:hypothetical protein